MRQCSRSFSSGVSCCCRKNTRTRSKLAGDGWRRGHLAPLSSLALFGGKLVQKYRHFEGNVELLGLLIRRLRRLGSWRNSLGRAMPFAAVISFTKAPINFTATVSVGLIPLGTDRGEGTPAPNPEKVRWSRPAPRPVEQGLAKRKIRGEGTPAPKNTAQMGAEKGNNLALNWTGGGQTRAEIRPLLRDSRINSTGGPFIRKRVWNTQRAKLGSGARWPRLQLSPAILLLVRVFFAAVSRCAPPTAGFALHACGSPRPGIRHALTL